MTLTKNKRPRHPEGDGGRGEGGWEPGVPAPGAQDSRLRGPLASPHPGDPRGPVRLVEHRSQQGWGWAGGRETEGTAWRRRQPPGTPCWPLTATAGFAQGASNNHRALKRKKKKILIWSISASSQARVRGDRQEQGSPMPSPAPQGARLSLCRRRGADTGLALLLRAPPPAARLGGVGRGGGEAEGAPRWAEPPIPVFHPASPGPPPQVRLRVV